MAGRASERRRKILAAPAPDRKSEKHGAENRGVGGGFGNLDELDRVETAVVGGGVQADNSGVGRDALERDEIAAFGHSLVARRISVRIQRLRGSATTAGGDRVIHEISVVLPPREVDVQVVSPGGEAAHLEGCVKAADTEVAFKERDITFLGKSCRSRWSDDLRYRFRPT